MKLDLNSQIILQSLSENARISLTELAKKTRFSKNSVMNRIKKLEKEKIILKYVPIINYNKFNHDEYILYLQTNQIFINENFYKKFPLNNIIEIISLFGEKNLYIYFIAKNLEEKNLILEKILKETKSTNYFCSKLLKREFIPAKKYYKDSKNSFKLEKNKSINKSRSLANKVQVTQLDYGILLELIANARKPITEIASKLKISSQLINYHLKNLKKNKIIKVFYTYTNYKYFNFQLYYLKIKNNHKSKNNKIFTYLKEQNLVNEVMLLEGEFDFNCAIVAETTSEISLFIKGIDTKFENMNLIFELLFAQGDEYYNPLPKCLKQLI